MRLAILSSHPIQYQVPLFRRIAQQPEVKLTVLFCHDHWVRPSFDVGFGTKIQFDIPLLEGYPYRFLRNIAPRPSPSPLGLLNPEIPSLLRSGEFDAMVVHGYAALTNILALATPRRRTRLLLRGDSNILRRRPRLVRAAKRSILPMVFGQFDHFLAIGTLNAEYY